MGEVRFVLNGQPARADVEPDMPLLWVLRDVLGSTGTKFSCGIGACGTCSVLIDGTLSRSCVVPSSSLHDTDVTTIEGLSDDGSHPVQRAWLDLQVAQCGYCQPGQIMTAAALLAESPNPTDEQIVAAFADVLCRCGTYLRVRQAVRRAAEG